MNWKQILFYIQKFVLVTVELKQNLFNKNKKISKNNNDCLIRHNIFQIVKVEVLLFLTSHDENLEIEIKYDVHPDKFVKFFATTACHIGLRLADVHAVDHLQNVRHFSNDCFLTASVFVGGKFASCNMFGKHRYTNLKYTRDWWDVTCFRIWFIIYSLMKLIARYWIFVD